MHGVTINISAYLAKNIIFTCIVAEVGVIDISDKTLDKINTLKLDIRIF